MSTGCYKTCKYCGGSGVVMNKIIEPTVQPYWNITIAVPDYNPNGTANPVGDATYWRARAEKAEAETAKLRASLESLRRSGHYHSCPKHPWYTGSEKDCTCGTDKTNAIIDEALGGVE